VTRVVVSQTLLPFLWDAGHLGGREVEVLLTRTPLLPLHKTLDALAGRYPDSATLTEFRAPAEVLRSETEALAAATRVVTPHRHLAAQFPGRVEILDWRPTRTTERTPGDRIAFPGPTAARKGAYEVRELARALDLEVVLYGSELEGDGFWDGVRTCRGTRGNFDGIRTVIQPAYLEDCPRALLSALAAGTPVIATDECGLPQQAGLRVVRSGDVAALVQAWRDSLNVSAGENLNYSAKCGVDMFANRAPV
jgi:glycosyltransferase involved in cell wall biosynthesis